MKGKLKMMKRAITNFDMGKYILVVGKDATDIFKFYDVKQMHGLNLKDAQAEEVDKTKGNGVYIYGLTNYNPLDKKLTAKNPYKPFVFLNMGTFKKYSADEQKTAIMHETVHLAMLLYKWDANKKSEEITTMAEEEANKIIEKLKKLKLIK
jgi:CRISPR/Cas system type I-B associated protein Csh2 (Cas7 group RAMP superfamily)